MTLAEGIAGDTKRPSEISSVPVNRQRPMPTSMTMPSAAGAGNDSQDISLKLSGGRSADIIRTEVYERGLEIQRLKDWTCAVGVAHESGR